MPSKCQANTTHCKPANRENNGGQATHCSAERTTTRQVGDGRQKLGLPGCRVAETPTWSNKISNGAQTKSKKQKVDTRVPEVGLEPTTTSLRGWRSTD